MPRSVQNNSSGGSQPQSNIALGQAVAAYLSGLSPEERGRAQELNDFVRWFGPQRPIRAITPPDLERYQEQLAAEARRDLSGRLEALKAFLAGARQQGLIETNLAVQVKLPKKKKRTAEQPQPAPAREPVDQGNGLRLTREGYDKLVKELEYLETEMRPRIANELRRAAADKDFRENAPYDVAKQHQGEVEARIRELKRIVETGEVVDVPRQSKPTSVDLGTTVRLRDLAEDEEIVYTLVGPGEIDPRRGKISIQSPVGRALSGKSVGDEVEVEVPAGTLRLRIEKIEH